MTNIEKYWREILKDAATRGVSIACAVGRIRQPEGCDDINCTQCYEINGKWLDMEYEEPKIDWSKVKQGTKVYHKQMDGYCAGKFIAEYEDRIILLFNDGGIGKSAYTKDNYEVRG